jgi:hypothetical protein
MAWEDLDRDRVDEVVIRWLSYCGQWTAPEGDKPGWALGPRLPTVYRWDGTAYVNATSRFPELLAETEANVRATLARADNWDPKDRACLHGALAYLAAKAGNPEAAAAECSRARQMVPSWREPDWMMDVCK